MSYCVIVKHILKTKEAKEQFLKNYKESKAELQIIAHGGLRK